jgi:hypothetical protein
MKMSAENFSYSFESSKSPEEIFPTLLDVRKWWYGVFDETITGSSKNVNDVFIFLAGGGVHQTTQKMVELIPNQKIAWLVTASNLNFLKKPDEWLNTKFYFDLSGTESKTKITFTHEGLQPEIECYDDCSGGWMQYLKKLEKKLK